MVMQPLHTEQEYRYLYDANTTFSLSIYELSFNDYTVKVPQRLEFMSWEN